MSTQATLGATALKENNYPEAIKQYSLALKSSQSPLWLIQRSTAYQRSGHHELALADADNAVLAAVSRARRELIAQAQFRRGVALHGLGRYGDARMCFVWSEKKDDKMKGITMWMARVKQDYEKVGGDKADCNVVRVKEEPDPVVEVVKEGEDKGKETDAMNRKLNGKLDKGKEPVRAVLAEAKPAVPTASAAPPKPTPKDKIKHDWYQTSTKVVITIMAKGVPKDLAQIHIEEYELDINFPVIGPGNTYNLNFHPLYNKIDTTQSTYTITPNKIEISLHKATPLKWHKLESDEPTPAPADDPNKSTIPQHILAPAEDKAPAYPTSSRTGPKNWDAIDAGPEEGDGVEDFFKTIYKGADEDTRRAMIKSYQESNGTALSTSWKDVSSRTFETTPPEGMEAKKFGG